MRVLCVVDSYRWALYNRAVALRSVYSRHSFEIKHFEDLGGISFNNYNVVYSLNWPIHGYISNKIAPKRLRKYRLITGISSHIGQPSDRKFLSLLSNYDGIGTSNKFLYNSFKKKFPKLKIFYTPFGVDCDTFYPTTSPSDYLNVFGWVGNPGRPVKRFAEIDRCIRSFGDEIKFLTATNRSKYSRDEMAKFYNRIGTLICFSESEGTPNPILEAGACGRNIITTNVGNVPELLSKIKCISVVKDKRGLEVAMRKAIADKRRLNLNGALLGQEISKSWTWKARSAGFRRLLSL